MSLELVSDNTEECLEELKQRLETALEICGQVAEGYAKEKCPVGEINGGTLRNSITHNVIPDEKAVIIGTNVEYAPYVEFGTGIFAEEGGRQTPWSYKDVAGNWHYTRGRKPKPYLRPAINDHKDAYDSAFSKFFYKK